MKKYLAIILAVMMFATMLTGCTGNNDQPVDNNSSTQGKEENQKDKEEILLVNINSDPTTFNPVAKADDTAYNIFHNLFDSLVQLNYNCEIVPDLATSWEITPDGLKYTFHLAEGVKWHDGEALTSEDVKFTYEAIIENKGVMANDFAVIDTIETPDDLTVVLNLKEPCAALLGYLAWYGNFIIPEHVYAGTDWLENEANNSPIGTGPFKFVEHKKGVSVTLEANAEYFKGAPNVDKVVYAIISDKDTALQAFYNGELDILTDIPMSEVPAMEQNSDIKLGNISAARRYQIACNMNDEHIGKQEVRKAIALGIDREEVSKKATNSLMAPAEGFYPPYLDWAYNDVDVLEARDVERAKALLEQAGYTQDANGMYLSITLDVFSGGAYTDCARVIQANLKDVGIDLKINVMENAAWSEKVRAGKHQLAMLSGFQGPDPAAMEKRIGSNGVANYSFYSNEKVDQLLKEANILVTNEDRGAKYKEVQKILSEELPIIPIVESASHVACYSTTSGVPYIDQLKDTASYEYTKVKLD